MIKKINVVIGKIIICALLIFNYQLLIVNCFAQTGGVAVNATGNAADNSSMLDISSTNQGLRIPRVALTSTTSADPITNPANSLLVYDSVTVGDVTPGFYYWDASKWVRLSSGSASGWSTSGNAGTDTATNFIGTTDDRSWVMKTDNTERMKISKSGNIGIGTSSPSNSAILDVNSTTKGVLISRMTTLQRNAIVSPSVGLQIFNIDCNMNEYYSGSCWVSMGMTLPSPHPITSNPISTTFCAGQTRTYTVPPVTGASDYNWSVPAGATINSGQGTTSVSVTFGSISGSICITANNNCETSPSSCIDINVSSEPVTPGNITGPISAIPGQTNTVSYSIASIPGATGYNWTVPPGAVITSGTGTTNIVVNYTCNTTAGYVAVTQTAACGTSTPASLAITVNPLLVGAGPAKTGPGVIGGYPTASGGTGLGSYIYAWSPSAGLSSTTIANPTANACTTTTYILTVTDINACTATSSVIVTKNLTASAGANQTGGYSGATLGGSPTASLGLAPYTYSWAPSSKLVNTTVSNPICYGIDGTNVYTVTVTDANSCTATSSVSATITISATPINTSGTALSSCQAIKTATPSSVDGIYWIKPASTAYQCYCDMTTDGGGWTLVENTGPKMTNNGVTGAVGSTPILPGPAQTTFAKLTDTDINLIRGAYATAIVKVVRSFGCNNNTIYYKHDKVFNSGCTTSGATISNYYTSYANAISNTSLQTSTPNGPGTWTEAIDSWSGGTVGYRIIFNYQSEGFISEDGGDGCMSSCTGCSSTCATNRSQCNVLIYIKQP